MVSVVVLSVDVGSVRHRVCEHEQEGQRYEPAGQQLRFTRARAENSTRITAMIHLGLIATAIP
jgi:hypothetical protein